VKTNTAATLYSRSIVNGAEVWTRTPITAVFWENRKAANVIQSGLLAADSAAVYIPDASVSVKVGDVLVKGAVTKAIGPAYTMTNLKADYTTITVRSVDLMDYGSAHLQHVQVGGS